MFNFTRAIVRHAKHSIGKYSMTRINSYSTAPVSAELKSPVNEPEPSVIHRKIIKSANSIVAAAFASLSSEKAPLGELRTPYLDGRIEMAKSIDELLSISAEGVGVSRRHALKVVSILATWSATGRVKLSEFESDARFIRLCRVLTKNNGGSIKSRLVGRSEDLSMIMNVAADDEAAKLVASITLPQMVKVMQTLATKKRRSKMLLRSLSYNITKNPDKLDLKQCADLLYSMCVLNFPDQNLLEKICADILQEGFTMAKRSALLGAIVTSLGLLKYKDTSGMFDALCAWMLEHHATCRAQDLFALFLTIGALNHRPANADALFETLAPLLSASDAQRPSVWLDHVWSLVVHERAAQAQIDGVLDAAFVARCSGVAGRIKLLHVNAASEGAKLPDDSEAFATRVARTKEKEDMVSSVLETLRNLMKGETYIQSNVDTNMGFFIDAECVIDRKCLPIASEKYSPSEGHVKLAIMALDYHDMCRGRVSPTGVVALQQRLLERRGYKVVHVPYSEYRLHDKLVHRVQLVETKLKAVVAPPSP